MSAKFAFLFLLLKIKNCTPAISFERFNVYSSINLENIKSGQERGDQSGHSPRATLVYIYNCNSAILVQFTFLF